MPSDKQRYAAMNRALIAAGRTNRIRGRLDGIDAAEMNAKITEIRSRNRFTVPEPLYRGAPGGPGGRTRRAGQHERCAPGDATQ